MRGRRRLSLARRSTGKPAGMRLTTRPRGALRHPSDDPPRKGRRRATAGCVAGLVRQEPALRLFIAGGTCGLIWYFSAIYPAGAAANGRQGACGGAACGGVVLLSNKLSAGPGARDMPADPKRRRRRGIMERIRGVAVVEGGANSALQPVCHLAAMRYTAVRQWQKSSGLQAATPPP